VQGIFSGKAVIGADQAKLEHNKDRLSAAFMKVMMGLGSSRISLQRGHCIPVPGFFQSRKLARAGRSECGLRVIYYFSRWKSQIFRLRLPRSRCLQLDMKTNPLARRLVKIPDVAIVVALVGIVLVVFSVSQSLGEVFPRTTFTQTLVPQVPNVSLADLMMAWR
jgi:hypothetical protein